jgi:hypothetical protein
MQFIKMLVATCSCVQYHFCRVFNRAAACLNAVHAQVDAARVFPPESPIFTQHLSHDRQGNHCLRIGQTVVFGAGLRSRGVLRSVTDTECEIEGYTENNSRRPITTTAVTTSTTATAGAGASAAGSASDSDAANSDNSAVQQCDSAANGCSTASSSTAADGAATATGAAADTASSAGASGCSAVTTTTAATAAHRVLITVPRSQVRPAHQSIFWRLLRPEFVKRRGSIVWEQRAQRQRQREVRQSRTEAGRVALRVQAAAAQAALAAEVAGQEQAGYGAADSLLYSTGPEVSVLRVAYCKIPL